MRLADSRQLFEFENWLNPPVRPKRDLPVYCILISVIKKFPFVKKLYFIDYKNTKNKKIIKNYKYLV